MAVGSAKSAARTLVEALRANANADNVEGMRRFGISDRGTLGVPTPVIWKLAREAVRAVGTDERARHELAGHLWETGIHEARLAAAKIDVPGLVTRERMERWAVQIDSWDVCDQLCMNCWWLVADADDIARDWAGREELFVKRAAFALVARFAWRRRDAEPSAFDPYLALIERESCDDRNEVKKAVNWALRQIGKRDQACNAAAIACAERILAEHPECPSARWIARDALRELRSDAVRKRLGL
ncbi:MAG: DNA alkylation repair protein [Coriobacteriales bacterium]|nr:DNA alkylation repair protein [Coriobacteriales bacterium]